MSTDRASNLDRENRLFGVVGRVSYLDVLEILMLRDRVEADGMPGAVFAVTDACIDCSALGTLFVYPGGRIDLVCFGHDPGCPAAAGAVGWRPAE